MADRAILVLAEELAEPAHAFAADDVVGVDARAELGTFAMCPPTTIVACGRCCRTSSHIFATLRRLGLIAEMPTTS